MSNMSYCRFENTAPDLGDCAEHILDTLEGTEAEARVRLVEYCADILEACGFLVVGRAEVTRETVTRALANYTED
jgi:hypothetical protein